MKANELMIGDWVQNPLGAKGYVRAISWIPPDKEGLDSTHLITMVYEGCVYSCAKLEEKDILPIPLTPEILEKNGFTLSDTDDDGAILYEYGPEHLWCDVWVNYSPCLFSAWKKWNGEEKPYNMVCELPIKYVHELQHALRLCGIEKKINL